MNSTNLNYMWTITNADEIERLFPSIFVKRTYLDLRGHVNFEVANGVLTGGYLRPLINERNPFKMSYDYYRQKLRFNFLYYKEKAVERGGQLAFVEIII